MVVEIDLGVAFFVNLSDVTTFPSRKLDVLLECTLEILSDEDESTNLNAAILLAMSSIFRKYPIEELHKADHVITVDIGGHQELGDSISCEKTTAHRFQRSFQLSPIEDAIAICIKLLENLSNLVT